MNTHRCVCMCARACYLRAAASKRLHPVTAKKLKMQCFFRPCGGAMVQISRVLLRSHHLSLLPLTFGVDVTHEVSAAAEMYAHRPRESSGRSLKPSVIKLSLSNKLPLLHCTPPLPQPQLMTSEAKWLKKKKKCHHHWSKRHKASNGWPYEQACGC